MKQKKKARSGKPRATLSKRSQRSGYGAKTEGASKSDVLPPRAREMKFASEHPQIFDLLVGKWVVLEGETIIAHGADPAIVVAQARESGIEVPFIFRVEPKLGKNEGRLGL